jgi:SAM-dependent methyltransferase
MKRTLIKIINNQLRRHADAAIVRRSMLYPWQSPSDTAAFSPSELGDTAARSYLTVDNPRLAELRSTYARLDPTVTSPLIWADDIISEHDLRLFRGDNAFVFQLGGLRYNELSYTLATYYTMSAREAPLLDRMSEDGAFGAYTIDVAGKRVSRDMLDAAREIDFLLSHAQVDHPRLRVLDIGAGYGRLAHRLTETVGDRVEVFATDAFPFSTFISEFYLRHRDSAATVVPLDEVDSFLEAKPIDVAVNIHSFSECTVEAIEWWVSRLAQHEVRYLMVVPNDSDGPELVPCMTNDGHDMEAVFRKHRYRKIASEFRYADPIVQRFGIDPAQLNMFVLG